MLAYRCDICGEYSTQKIPFLFVPRSEEISRLFGIPMGEFETTPVAKIDACHQCFSRIENAVKSIVEERTYNPTRTLPG